MYNQTIKQGNEDEMERIVLSVLKNSIADRHGIKPGDEILSINGELIKDYIDYAYFMGEEKLSLYLRDKNGRDRAVIIRKEDWEDIGLSIGMDIDKPERCRNKCVFCFVDQLPRGMRKTLYVKDDDWRHSFLMGNYVTLTNLSEEDVQRIIRRKISPLYISVHATDEEVRGRMLGSAKLPALLPLLRRLAQNGILFHAQIVVCPGINDGDVLEKTVRDLFRMHPQAASVAVVPVGLTRYREGLPAIRPVSGEMAAALLGRIHAMQNEFLSAAGTRFVFAADELYIRAGKEMPGISEYEDFPQIENGVGLIRRFEDEVEQGIGDFKTLKYKKVSVATGTDFAPFLKKIAKNLNRIYNITVNVYAVENDFFGPEVTVTGLLTGRDIAAQLKGKDLGEKLFLSGSIFREFEDVTLDDKPIGRIAEELGVPCEAAPADGYEWIALLAKEKI